ncbi:hypothetical protein ACFUN7_32230 [Streptomyces sp. NPDC057236]|uniref:hypothetical protein n=1 Tax=Streptomyces sp. NPDC057236 TaxID=3346059 RepID=UPI003625E7D1
MEEHDDIAAQGHSFEPVRGQVVTLPWTSVGSGWQRLADPHTDTGQWKARGLHPTHHA